MNMQDRCSFQSGLRNMFCSPVAAASRDTRDLLKTTSMDDAYAFVDSNSHPRLWRILAEHALEQLDFSMADKAFVRCADYQGIQVGLNGGSGGRGGTVVWQATHCLRCFALPLCYLPNLCLHTVCKAPSEAGRQVEAARRGGGVLQAL